MKYRQDGRGLVRLMGAVQLQDVSAGMLSDLLGNVRAAVSDARARELRKTLSGVMRPAVNRGAVTTNPVREAENIPSAPRRESVLTPEGFRELEAALETWGGGAHKGGTKTDWRALRDALLLCVTTSARINEIAALERRDALPGGRLHIGATLVYAPGLGAFRQEYTKGKKWKSGRTVALTPRARETVERLLQTAGEHPTAPLFPNSKGEHLAADRMGKRMRAFRKSSPDLWLRLGIPEAHAATHLMRRSALTAVTRAGGVTLATELAGHSSEAVTRRSYVSPASEVSPLTAEALEGF